MNTKKIVFSAIVAGAIMATSVSSAYAMGPGHLAFDGPAGNNSQQQRQNQNQNMGNNNSGMMNNNSGNQMMGGNTSSAGSTYSVSQLQQLIQELMAKIAALMGGDQKGVNGNFSIASINVADGGDEDYIDEGDTIKIIFNKTVDAASINDSLEAGSSVSDVDYSDAGGVSIDSDGVLTIEGIAKFDVGTVEDSGNFDVDLALSSNGKTLTITLADGDDVELTSERFGRATQISGTITDEDENELDENGKNIFVAGTFGGSDTSDETSPYITSITAVDKGDDDVIEEGDIIKIAFSEAIDPESINDDLSAGGSVSSIDYDEVGGVSIDSDGVLTIEGIASFDVGDVEDSEDYTVKLTLSANEKLLTITLTSGDDVEISDKDFSDGSQISDVLADINGNAMESDDLSDSVLKGSF